MHARGGQLERGFVIAGYRIDELISRGGMGEVYRVTNIALNRIYALKVLASELADDPAFRERFRREMRIAASIKHPNVVSIRYAGEQDGLVFFVMDFVYGSDLREVIRKSGPIEPNRAVALLVQLASALDAAHARGLVHRDVKSANILITVSEGEEHAYLTDFGVAKRANSAAGLTAKGAVVGTVDYMSPEQITGRQTDARTDVYALGCVFFQMLTGKVPFERENSIAKLFAHVHEEPPAVEGPVADRYPAFLPVLEKAMAKDPAARYLSAGDFARDATAALRGTRYTGPETTVGVGDAKPSDAERTTGREPAPLPEPRDGELDRTTAAGLAEAEAGAEAEAEAEAAVEAALPAAEAAAPAAEAAAPAAEAAAPAAEAASSPAAPASSPAARTTIAASSPAARTTIAASAGRPRRRPLVAALVALAGSRRDRRRDHRDRPGQR
jgi:tRNA A-37 threonylcarbamoyl transferase component Bud32